MGGKALFDLSGDDARQAQLEVGEQTADVSS
jgi:hypothetical protein